MVGTLPASMPDLVDVTYFDMSNNNISGALPAMNFTTFFPAPYSDSTCRLFDQPHGGANTFLCPWPEGALANCYKAVDLGVNWVPITEYDCTPTYRCTGGQCVFAASGASQADCEALCTPTLYRCSNNTCVSGGTGVPQAICESSCGPAQPLLRGSSTTVALE